MKYVRRAVLVVGVVGLVAALAGCSDSTHGSSGTLTLSEPGGKTGSFGLVGKPTRKGFPPGTGFAFFSPLQDTSKKTVGELNAVCMATQQSPGEGINGTCSATATVPGGSFSLNVGGKEIGDEVSGAIVGGTGKYEGAYGAFKSVEHGSGQNAPSTLTFEYTLP